MLYYKYNKFIMKNIVLIVCLLAGNSTFGQYVSHVAMPDTSKAIITDMGIPSVKYASTITGKDIKEHLMVLASDEYEGRETGQPGIEKAAQYISSYLQKLGMTATGLENSYYQPVIFSSSGWNNSEIQVGEEKFKHLWDYMALPASFDNMKDFSTDEVVFLGYGIDDPKYSDYTGKNVAGKVIMIYQGEPVDKNGNFRITGTDTPSIWSEETERKIAVADQKGAKMILIVSNDLKGFLMENRKYMLGASLKLGDATKEAVNAVPLCYVSTSLAEAIIGSKKRKVTKVVSKITKNGKSKSIPLKTDFKGTFDNFITTLEGKNVMGFVEGSDLKDQIIVVSAHYDHLGKRGKDIFNGADDNGSGTSTVLDMAEAFMQAKADGEGPRRSILFLFVTGEEKGLLGSKWYAENPTFPLQNIVADVNVDMIGRIDDRHEHANYIYVIGSDRLSTDLHRINEKMNNDFVQMELDYTYNSEEDPNRYYYRSDHYNFAEKGIPAIFFFSGTHKDYHRPSDTVDKILFDKVERTGRLIFHTTWELANRDDRIRLIEGISRNIGN